MCPPTKEYYEAGIRESVYGQVLDLENMAQRNEKTVNLKNKENQDFLSDLEKELLKNYNVAPLLEAELRNEKFRREHSLQNNKQLCQEWKNKMQQLDSRDAKPKEPLLLPSLRHIHFHNCMIKFIPSQSLDMKSDFRMKMRYGGGVDKFGVIPMPVGTAYR